MKKVYLLALVFSLYSLTTIAATGDTLTNAQIYNFNVGDTFDYKYWTEDIDMGLHSTGYERRVVLQKTFSTNLDTIYYGFGYPGWLPSAETITDLDSTPILQIPNPFGDCQMDYVFDTTTYSGHLSNSLFISCFEISESQSFAEGLGETGLSDGRPGMNGFGCVCHSKELVYYSNGVTNWGTPYTVLNGTDLIHYIALPEECAMWTRTVTGSANGTPPYQTIIEQIRTGNKIYKSGRSYVELYCNINYVTANHFTADSFLGYFFNDTIGRAACFVTDTNSISYYQFCKFDMPTGMQCSPTGAYNIGTVLIGGSPRTYWGCSGGTGVIAGIGNLDGLLRINQLHDMYYYTGSLTCFSVCGQKLYPTYDTISPCSILSGITETPLSTPQFSIYPNPATNTVTINIDETMLNSTLTVYDITGKKMAAVQLRASDTQLPTIEFSSGIYFVTIENEKGRATKKLVIEQ